MILGGSHPYRQRMINLMYLVFIALLAMKVSPRKEEQPRKAEEQQDTARQAQAAAPQASSTPRPQLEALVLPPQGPIVTGVPTRGRLVLALRDSSLHPELQLGTTATPLDAAGTLSLPTSRAGRIQLAGWVLVTHPDGRREQLPWHTDYEVLTPQLSLSPALTQVVYAGIDNPLELAAAGLSTEALVLTARSGGTLRSLGAGRWSARPTLGAEELRLAIAQRLPDGGLRPLGERSLRIRPLPDPLPYLQLGAQRFRGGRISRSALLSSAQVQAALDDALLDVRYSVERFQLIAFDALGNALPEVSSGSRFSERQLQLIRETPRGRRLYISEIIARGPDGLDRRLPSLELILH
ncbi:type IX secretion system motor protein PorM/GldM [Porphyromonas sp.]